jgi:hypothetical protein
VARPGSRVAIEVPLSRARQNFFRSDEQPLVADPGVLERLVVRRDGGSCAVSSTRAHSRGSSAS